jgi:hypothetical protein
MKLDFQCVKTHWNRGFMTSWRGPRIGIVMLLIPVWPAAPSGARPGIWTPGLSARRSQHRREPWVEGEPEHAIRIIPPVSGATASVYRLAPILRLWRRMAGIPC